MTRPLRIVLHTLGCRLNQFESDGILGNLIESGNFTSVEHSADVAIVNTCTVTDRADSRNRNAIRSIIKNNPGARIIVTGCYAQTDPEKISEIPGVDLVVGNDRKSRLARIIRELSENNSLEAAGRENVGEGLPVLENPFAYGTVRPQGHTRAYLKVQDGCDRKCSYCKIPQARGRGVSRGMAEILEEVARLQDEGIPEIVLTGVNLGWYRDGSTRFNELVENILNRLSTARLRLSSIEPCDVDAPLAELSLHPRFCNFLHVPLQSGSVRILKHMRRTYNPHSFRRRMETVLSVNPRIFFGTDVIAGFPGETEQDFQDTYELCRDIGFGNIHSFRFSARSGTPAAELKDRPPPDLVRERMLRLDELRLANWKTFVRRETEFTQDAVVENQCETGEYHCTGDNFLKFRIRSDRPLLRGAPVRLRIVEILPDRTVQGEISD